MAHSFFSSKFNYILQVFSELQQYDGPEPYITETVFNGIEHEIMAAITADESIQRMCYKLLLTLPHYAKHPLDSKRAKYFSNIFENFCPQISAEINAILLGQLAPSLSLTPS